MGEIQSERYSRWILIWIVAMTVLFILRFAGSFAIRYLLPIVAVGGLVYLALRYLRQRSEEP
ncbi:MAG: hypothetical protein R3C44_08760 [Chloroflexota bacterium]